MKVATARGLSLLLCCLGSFSAASAEEAYDPIITELVEKISAISQLNPGAELFDGLKALEVKAKADLALLRSEKSYRPNAHFALLTVESTLAELPFELSLVPSCDVLRTRLEANFMTPIAEQDWPAPQLWQFGLLRVCVPDA